VSAAGGAAAGLPAGLVSMPPGSGLAALLASIDRSRVAAEDLRDLVRARARQVAFDQAELLADVYDAGRAGLAGPGSLERDGPAAGKFAADVVSWMLYITPSYAQVQLDLARALIERLPAVYAALRAGDLDVANRRRPAEGLRFRPDRLSSKLQFGYSHGVAGKRSCADPQPARLPINNRVTLPSYQLRKGSSELQRGCPPCSFGSRDANPTKASRTGVYYGSVQ
jgi:hypothetical protein